MKRYKVVSQNAVFRPPYDDKNTPEQQLEDFLNGQMEKGWLYRDTVSSSTSDRRVGSDLMILESDKDPY